MAHSTLKTFGYPDSLVYEYEHWCVLLRPGQVTLGSLVMVAKAEVTQFSALSPAAFAEMARVTDDIETHLPAVSAYQKINYLMLMMVDPHVHFHVIPRYDHDQSFAGEAFVDHGWPGVPQLAKAVILDPSKFEALRQALISAWSGG